MSEVGVRPMTEFGFDRWQRTIAEEFAAEQVAAGRWAAEGSVRRALESNSELLPLGLSMPRMLILRTARLRTPSSTLGVLALVSAGAGIAVVPSVLECLAMPGVSYRPLTGAAGISIVVAIRRGEPTATVSELLRVSGVAVGSAW